MKKRKSLAALLLALTLLAPTLALASCSEESAALPDPPSAEEAPLDPPQTNEPPKNEDTETPDGSDSSDGSIGNTPPAVLPSVEKTEYIRCTGDSVNLRSGAGVGYAVVGSAKKGETYAVAGKTGSWYKTYYRGKAVYMSASYAAVLSLEQHENDTVEAVLTEGYKLLGVPYVYGAVRLHDGKGNMLGGFTAQKFDCSSLVQYVFYKGAGKVLQVNTRTQIKQGKYVKPSELQRGDCIFFTNEARQHLTGIERVGHVAIYLGENYILHTASDYARIEKMTAERWNFYIEARRFI